MAYVVVVFTIINSAALVGFAIMLLIVVRELPMWVETAVQDEIRKQDDRIEKRVAKVQGTRPTDEESLEAPVDGRMVVGRPYRR